MASFDVKVKGVTNVTSNIKKLFQEIKSDPTLLNKIGETIVDNTQKTIRAGKSPATQERFPPISKGWKNRKEKLKPFNTVSEYYRKGASNLTFTGQLVESISYKIVGSVIKVFSSGDRKPYIGVKGKPIPQDLETNPEVIDDLSKRGWKALGVSDQAKNLVNKLVRLELLKRIRALTK